MVRERGSKIGRVHELEPVAVRVREGTALRRPVGSAEDDAAFREFGSGQVGVVDVENKRAVRVAVLRRRRAVRAARSQEDRQPAGVDPDVLSALHLFQAKSQDIDVESLHRDRVADEEFDVAESRSHRVGIVARSSAEARRPGQFVACNADSSTR